MSRSPHTYASGHLVLVVDCADLDAAADFWTAVLGYVREGPAGDTYLALVPADGAGMEILLQRVPERKQAKNRLHLDLRTRDLDREVERVLALGAVLVTEEPRVESGWRWHVLADPDGNEFCVLRPPPEYWPART